MEEQKEATIELLVVEVLLAHKIEQVPQKPLMGHSVGLSGFDESMV